MEGIVSEVVGTSIKLYALMTPPAVLSAFISGTKEYDKKRKVTVAFKTSTAIFIIGVVLYLFGSNLFELFGFTLDAFRIGSGVLLMLTAVALMNDDGSQVHTKREGGMGPASIGAVMVMGASAEDLHEMLVGVFSLLLAAAGMFLLLCLADGVARVLRRTGIAVLSKLTGLLLAAIAAQVIFTGVSAFLK